MPFSLIPFHDTSVRIPCTPPAQHSLSRREMKDKQMANAQQGERHEACTFDVTKHCFGQMFHIRRNKAMPCIGYIVSRSVMTVCRCLVGGL